MNKSEALKYLSESDHCFLNAERTKEIGRAFGVKVSTYKAVDNRSEFKGLTLNGINPDTKLPYKEGDTREGQDAHRLAMQICKGLELDYQDMFGIGSQLRACCESIAEWLHNKTLAKEKATSPEVA
jgi:hypothetical protein